MEYLVLAGSELQASLSQSLGEYGPFFWSVIAPVGLAILWLGGLYTLWESWFGQGSEKESGGSLVFKLLFSLIIVTLVLCSGAGLEFLLLGDGYLQSRVLAGVLDFVGSL
jgi:hypothetical protein